MSSPPTPLLRSARTCHTEVSVSPFTTGHATKTKHKARDGRHYSSETFLRLTLLPSMITPHFSCVQNETKIEVHAYFPIFLLDNIKITIESPVLTLRVYPYFLRLKFPHAVKDDEKIPLASYDPDAFYVTIWVTKAVHGQEFEDLDLPARLLMLRKGEHRERIPLVGRSHFQEVTPIESEFAAKSLSSTDKEMDEAVESAQQIKQKLAGSKSSSKTPAKHPYGFLDLYTGYFEDVEQSEGDVNELGADVENCDPLERRRRRLKHEDDEFDAGYYTADLLGNHSLPVLCSWSHPFSTLRPGWSFSKEENLVALTLPHKEYRISPAQSHHLYLTLLTFLFSYAYDRRITQGETTSESAWTICALTPAISALDSYPYTPSHNLDLELFEEAELTAAFAASYRRSFAFPLYRSYALAEACRSDVSCFLAGGKQLVLRCLLEMKKIIDQHDTYHVYCKIWIDDFCRWAQGYASDRILKQLASSVSSLKVPKSLLGWDLEKLEALAGSVPNPESDGA